MMDENNRNFILALVLSVLVIFTWQALFVPKPDLQELQQQQAQEVQNPAGQATPGAVTPQPNVGVPTTSPQQTAAGGTPAGQEPVKPREAVLKEAPRIAIDTPSLQGSISLKGARIDDLTFKRFKETTKKNSDKVTLLAPSGSPKPYYAEYGWLPASNTGAKVPEADTIWTAEAQNPLTPDKPVTLRYENGEGLTFRRTIAVDRDYMFTVTQEVENTTNGAVTLSPYALISRHGQPQTAGIYYLHEGLIGVMGEEGLKEEKYKDALEDGTTSFKATSGWIGITDKYWATALIPDQKVPYEANFKAWNNNDRAYFQTEFLLGPIMIAPGAKQSVSSKFFAGAKQTQLMDEYEEKLGIAKFELMIDWGWFHFITKPLFFALDFFNTHIGNFGIAILIVTTLIKLTFFPLANKSYESMSKMKKLQPEMTRIRDRFKDDRVRQQQAMMELYKKEKVNPMAGCLPIVIQIPVFFALYKVLYITIEARHAPFFGWIQDLSSPDPTSLFNLFGLIPWDPPSFLMIGVWPLMMGITMFVQMKLNPAPADPVQQQIFTWMPLLFTFLLASFPAGLVIYWTWNNSLSILQQWVIMRRQGVEVNLLENIGFRKSAGTTGKG